MTFAGAGVNTEAKKGWTERLDLASKGLWHTSMLVVAMEADLPSWARTTLGIASKQAFVIRPILKGFQIIDHYRELKETKEDGFQVGFLTNLIAFDLFYILSACLFGAQLVTKNQMIQSAGQMALKGLFATLPGIYIGIAYHAIRRDREAQSKGLATADDLHKTTYDLFQLLLSGVCDAFMCGFLGCKARKMVTPALGIVATWLELYRIST